ncbi:hypothetical protein F3087_45635 [Nocardia colli]|uniref:Uncharacterized protein n=1 Tax=Nocardia colli TaxID=2545717 RepID=A0A5N0DJD7_9NOCA|nr:hypothetical protein [Nocardia colli]KAA8877187.1 hypothetical protein F3087_45635 [Nocardia colli]
MTQDLPSVEAWILREAREHLEEDVTGIYQLLWLLRGSQFDLDDHTAMTLARRAAARLLSGGEARLIRMVWPKSPAEHAVPIDSNLEDHSDEAIFEFSECGEYLALDPIDS